MQRTQRTGGLLSGLIILLGSLGLAPSASLAEVNVKTHYYPVVATTADELLREIQDKGPGRFAANARWDVRYDFKYWRTGSNCRLTEINLFLDISYRMPDWINKDFASPDLKMRWDKWFYALLIHEQQHGNHGRQAYNELRSGFMSVSSASNCEILSSELSDIWREVRTKYSQKDKDYDISTDHGRSEGAGQEVLTTQRDVSGTMRAVFSEKKDRDTAKDHSRSDGADQEMPRVHHEEKGTKEKVFSEEMFGYVPAWAFGLMLVWRLIRRSAK